MNPEFQRNLWLEAGPKRLAWAGVALLVVYGATVILAEHRVLNGLGVAGVLVFISSALIWGSRIAGRAVGDEVGERTWDFQRLSALEPWSMTWGKLFGATSLSWLVALSGLFFVLLSVFKEGGPAMALQALLGCAAAAVLLQAGSMAVALLGVRRARAEGRAAAVRFTFGGVLGIFLILSVVGRLAPLRQFRMGAGLPSLFSSSDQHWWGLSISATWFAVMSLAAFAAWALVGAWRLMRLELQMRNAPWAWPGFVAFAAVWAAGSASGAAARWAAAGAVFAACAYVATFAEPADRVRLCKFVDLVRRGRWAEAAFDFPAALAPVLFTGIAVLGLTASGADAGHAPSPSVAAAAFAFLIRDLGIVAYFRFGPRPRRSDLGAVVALFLAYFVGGVARSALLFPDPNAAGISAVSGTIMALGAWTLAWKRIRAREHSTV